MALSWARKRQVMYATGVFVFLVFLTVLIYFIFIFESATCFDGKHNGAELSIDKGGDCERLDGSQVRQLNILWAEALSVREGLYNAVAHIENANIDAEARNVDYRFTFYGPRDEVLQEKTGTTFFPRNQRIAVFVESVQSSVPIVRSEFSFTSEPEWYIDVTPDPRFEVRDRDIEREDTMPRVIAKLENISVKTLYNIDAVAVVYDDFGNPIAASRTIVERLGAGETAPLTYTWPQPYMVGETACAVPVDAMLVVDRSGSMDDDGATPPQPLTDAKEASQTFVNQMGIDDRVGVVTFANTASQPIDSPLSFAHEKTREVLGNISILKGEIQNTNVYDGLRASIAELNTGRATTTARHVIVALTDGIATRPVAPAGSGMTNEAYATAQAIEQAHIAKSLGYQVYTIGLGASVEPDFLSALATTPEHYFQAPTSDKLDAIYKEIASSICKLGPKVIEIIPRLPADQY